jgi:hypothetical protein
MMWPSELNPTTAAAWVGATSGTIALWINWRNRRDALRKERRERDAKKPWATLHPQGFTDGHAFMQVTFHNPSQQEFDLTTAEVRSPKNAKLVMLQRSEPAKSACKGLDFKRMGRSVPIAWHVKLPKLGDTSFLASATEFAVELPDLINASAGGQVFVDLEFKGLTRPPLKDPVRMRVKVVVSP